ncbi:Zn-dependent hydrolase [Acuticoccus sp. MNP-M23]|uniref:Zn-dependent hydrolase n=1 Tax=Acuticoccus sp. MNP-M23 TaxID=3072793 RepID=UPI0028166E21|nr:Zn-dependent hydrolase [Acuticoccus sp. MNP-M23]WMS42449.1 Zn-dependent hydrolase [Acuticoccus sp. MNP-M23]
MQNLKIDGERLWDSLMETARFGALPLGGIRRLALSDEDRMVRDWFRSACEAADLTVTVDGVGNMFATRPGTNPAAKAVAFGSHLDTQPAGGKFDGILGVLAGLEAIRTLNDAGYVTEHPLTLVNFTNEEGARFSPAMMCSGVYSGDLPLAPVLAGVDGDGHTFEDELTRIGYAGDEPIGERRFHAFVELHIEQGPLLEAADETIGVVTGGQGLLWFDGTITGQDSHAGTTPMTLRRDAMTALAAVTLAIEDIARQHGPAGVGTVGEVRVLPGSRNTIPGTATFKAEFRHPDNDALSAMETELATRIAAIAAERRVTIETRRSFRKDPTTFDKLVVDAIESAAKDLPHRKMISGAGHDAFYMASTCPTAMIFIPCKDGISHNELESATPGHCTAGGQILLDTILRLAR